MGEKSTAFLLAPKLAKSTFLILFPPHQRPGLEACKQVGVHLKHKKGAYWVLSQVRWTTSGETSEDTKVILTAFPAKTHPSNKAHKQTN